MAMVRIRGFVAPHNSIVLTGCPLSKLPKGIKARKGETAILIPQDGLKQYVGRLKKIGLLPRGTRVSIMENSGFFKGDIGKIVDCQPAIAPFGSGHIVVGINSTGLYDDESAAGRAEREPHEVDCEIPLGAFLDVARKLI